ncbi:MAG TPA: hypothetical protein VLB46_17510 [Pyrinomonadaceae bacterium]|nr:hypothetical protein [Pyrinomonadaceae bacterium]
MPQVVPSQIPDSEETSRAVDYFESIYERFKSTQQATGAVERRFLIGGYLVRLSFSGPALLSLTRALEHLASDDQATPDLTICLWDSESTGQRMISRPWQESAFLARGVIQGYNTERIYTAFQHGSGAVSVLDQERSLAVFWAPDHKLPYWEYGSPVRTILHWWLLSQGLQLVHAAAVGNATGGVLIGGKGGSGKSTTALACLESNLFYAGDDYTLLGLEPRPVVHSLYNSAKLNSDHARRFPALLPKIANPERLADEKALLFVNEHYAAKVATRLPVRAILLPRVTGLAETRYKRVSVAMALAALAPSTIFQLPRAGNEALKFLAAFARHLPCFSLEVGTDLAAIPPAIEKILAQIDSAGLSAEG